MELLAPAASLESQLLAKLAADLNPDQEMEDWSKYIDPDPARWIQSHFYIKDTKAPLQLFPSQIIPLREALSKDENQLYKYSTVVWSSVKKTGKTLIAAAAISYFAWQKPWASCKCWGNDQRQADSRVFGFVKQAFQLHPEWSQVCKIVNNRITLPNHSIIEAVPVDPEGEAGAADDFVSYTEIWGWRSKSEQRAWSESTLAPAKFGKSIRWIDSYAGETGASPILEKLYEEAVKNGECINQEYEMYRNKRLFALWCTKHHLPYHSKEYLEQEAQTLTPDEYRRLHQNQWVSPTSSFVPVEWWVACKSPAPLPPLDPNEPVIAAVDAAIESDCFAIVLISGWPGDKYAVRYARAWYPPKGDRIHFRTAAGDGPEDELRRLIDQYNVIEVAYDPYQLKDLAERFTGEMLANMTEFGQQGPRAKADKQLYDMIRDRSIIHSGEQDLQKHISNANSKAEGESKLRIVKRSQLLKIDLAVCLSMGVDRARSYNLASMH